MSLDDHSRKHPDAPRPSDPAWVQPQPVRQEQPRSGTPRVASIALVVLFVFSGMFAAFAGGMIFERSVVAKDPEEEFSPAQVQSAPLDTFARAWQVVKDYYVDEPAIDEQQMLNSAIDGMLATLGDEGHTRYLTAEETAQDRESSQGSYVGIGIQVEQTEENEFRVITPFEGSPAYDAGIMPGDVIVAVNGIEVGTQSLQEVINQIRGIEGTPVEVTFRKVTTGERVTHRMVRSRITISSVSWMMLDNKIALLRLSQFTSGSGDDLARALSDAKKAGAEGVILDLRNNPGGYVVEAMKVASMFVPDNSVVFISQTRDGGRVEHRSEKKSVHIEDLPFVVLINQGSASSSEIVSGAIKAAGVSTVIGEVTSGTGTILNQFELGDGSTIWLGVELWLTPEGNMIREEGIRPDVVVSLREGQYPFSIPPNHAEAPVPELDDAQLEYAIRVLLNGEAGASISSPGWPISRMN
jgi:carboxyl-terminal processing protease